MNKDDAQNIAYDADGMSLEELLDAYNKFQDITDNTPNHMPDKSMEFQRAYHAAQGMVTEAGEILDPFKKHLYGKQIPVRYENLKEESGDMFYYLNRFVHVNGWSLKDIIKNNVIKLANRYIEKFEV